MYPWGYHTDDMDGLRKRLLMSHVVAAPLLALATLGACSESGQAQAQSGVVHELTGADVYAMSCARCHGANREGKTDAPKLDTTRMASLGDQPLRMTIVYGKGRMRGFGGLSQQQVDKLVAFLRGEGA